jgi:hypothetical protein
MLEREVRMFWKRKVQQGVEELPGSQEIPDRVGVTIKRVGVFSISGFSMKLRQLQTR